MRSAEKLDAADEANDHTMPPDDVFGDFFGSADSLESCHDSDLPVLQCSANTVGPHGDNLSVGVRLVGDDSRLAAGKGHGRNTEVVDGHGQQRHGNPFSNTYQHVQLSPARRAAHLLRQLQELVGGVSHRGDHHHHPCTGLVNACDLRSNTLDAGDIFHRRSPVFVDHNLHGLTQ